MVKWKKSTVWAIIVGILLCVVVLMIFAINFVVLNNRASQENYLVQCRQVLEIVQGYEGYDIITERENHGTLMLNHTVTIHDYGYEDNWLQIQTVPDGNGTSLFAYKYVNGVYYEGIPVAENVASGEIRWEDSVYQGNEQPWLATFQWNEDVVTLDYVEDTGVGTIVHLIINDSFVLGEWTAREYTVDFIFDAQNEFLAARQDVEFCEEYSITSTMRIVSLDADLIKSYINLSM